MSVYGNQCFDYKQMLVTEAYFGKTETLQEIEKQIGVIRQVALNKYTDINRSPEVLKLNRLFEKQFGMDCFALYIEQNNTINAYTMPVALNFDVSMKINLSTMVTADTQNGYRFKEGNNLCIICNVYLGLIKNTDFTDAEIVAVILHELGHNFADCIYKQIYVYNQARSEGYLKWLIWSTILTLGLKGPSNLAAYLRFNNKHKSKVNKKTRKRRIRGLLKGIKASTQDFGSYIDEILARLQGTSIRRNVEASRKRAEEKGIPAKVKKSLNRQNEVIADKFAGIYGYGPEQASALVKMHLQVSKASITVDKIPFIGKSNNADYDEACKDVYKFDEHPHVIQRLNEEIKTLEYEIAKADIDPKLIEAAKAQVEQLKTLRDTITKVTDDMTDKEKARAEFYNNINETDPDAVDEEIEKAITAAFDDLFEE